MTNYLCTMSEFLKRIVFLVPLIFFFAGLWWKAELTAEFRITDTLLQLVDNQEEGLEQVRELAEILGAFASSKRRWIESNFSSIEQPVAIGTNATTFAVFGIGACGWASELAVVCFNRLGYDTRIVQILDAQGAARHIVMDIRLPSGEWVICDPLLNHLHLEPSTGLPMSSEELGERWDDLCSSDQQSGVCQYSFVHGARYTKRAKFGMFQVPFEWVAGLIGIDSLRSFCLCSRQFLCNMLLVLSAASFMWIQWSRSSS